MKVGFIVYAVMPRFIVRRSARFMPTRLSVASRTRVNVGSKFADDRSAANRWSRVMAAARWAKAQKSPDQTFSPHEGK